MKNKKTVKNKITVVSRYKVFAKIIGRTYEAAGMTIDEAITNLKPGNCKGRCILTVQNGDVKKEKILMPILAFRLFNTYGISKQIALRNVTMMFQGI